MPSIADVQLDLIFAIAHDEGKNPVAVSRSGQIPEAGTPEAERALGRVTATHKGQGGSRKRTGAGEKEVDAKTEQRFTENAGKAV